MTGKRHILGKRVFIFLAALVIIAASSATVFYTHGNNAGSKDDTIDYALDANNTTFQTVTTWDEQEEDPRTNTMSLEESLLSPFYADILAALATTQKLIENDVSFSLEQNKNNDEKQQDNSSSLQGQSGPVMLSSTPRWPEESEWIFLLLDGNESKPYYRNVNTTYYYFDEDYLYLRMCNFAKPNLSKNVDGRYKWFIGVDDGFPDMVLRGGSFNWHDYILMVENTYGDEGTPYLMGKARVDADIPPDGDGVPDDDKIMDDDWGDIYQSDRWALNNSSYGGFRVVDYCVDMYVKLDNISNPDTIAIGFATDNDWQPLDQALYCPENI